MYNIGRVVVQRSIRLGIIERMEDVVRPVHHTNHLPVVKGEIQGNTIYDACMHDIS